MSKLSTDDLFGGEWTSSPEASHASHTAQPESDWARTTNATSGQRCVESYQRLPRPSSWAKTFAACLIGMEGWSSRRCALTWRLWGTKYGRVSFQLRVSAHPTDVIASGLLLKTPCAADAYTEGLSKKEQRFGNSGTLAQEVQSGFIYQRGMLPTPTMFDYNTPRSPEAWERAKEKHGDALQVPLRQLAANELLPTPKCQEARGNASRNRGKANLTDEIAERYKPTSSSSQLNPRFVAEMMGFPVNWTELPFQSGEPKASKPTETP